MKRRLSIRLAMANIIIISIVMLLHYTSFVLRLSFFMDAFLFNEFLRGTFYFYLTSILPVTIFVFIVNYFFLRPLDNADNLSSNDTKQKEIIQNRLRRVQALIILSSGISILAVSLKFIVDFALYDTFSYAYVGVTLFYVFFLISISVLIQLSVFSLMLRDLRETLEIHFLTKADKIISFKVKHNVSALAIIGIMVSSSMLFGYELYTLRSYTSIALHSVVNEDLTKARMEANYRAEMSKYIKIIHSKVEDKYLAFPYRTSLEEIQGSGLKFYIISAFPFILLALVGVYYFANNFGNELAKLINRMSTFVKGEADLNQRINISELDEVGELGDLINRFMGNLKSSLLQVATVSHVIRDSSISFGSSVEKSSAFAESILSSLRRIEKNTKEEFALVKDTRNVLHQMLSSIDDILLNVDSLSSFVAESSNAINNMAETISSVSKSIFKADNLMSNLVLVAEDGGEAVSNSSLGIKNIEESSEHVKNIVSVISQIAEQTNLLAMNAAIEAAHAGDAGQGFAVVADEVRKLAESSSDSADEIIGHIQKMTTIIDEGVILSNQAGKAFYDISKGIGSSSTLIKEISTSMDEQNKSSADILHSIGSVVKSTNELKTFANKERENSEKIQETVENLTNIFNLTSNAVTKQAEDNNAILNMIKSVSDLSNENLAVVEKLTDIINAFNFKEIDKENKDVWSVPL